MYFSFTNLFFPSKFPHIRQRFGCATVCAVWVTQRHAIAFLKFVNPKSNFSQIFEWQEILRGKTNKSYDKTAVRKDPGNNTKRNCKLDSGKHHG